METIPPLFWMILLTFLAIFFCLILYYIAMLFKETSQTVAEVKTIVKESRGMIKNVEKILEESSEIVSAAKRTTLMIENTASEMKEHIIQPIKKIGGIFSMVAGFFDGFKK
jgi:predicted PurR-regulated permease PerM